MSSFDKQIGTGGSPTTGVSTENIPIEGDIMTIMIVIDKGALSDPELTPDREVTMKKVTCRSGVQLMLMILSV